MRNQTAGGDGIETASKQLTDCGACLDQLDDATIEGIEVALLTKVAGGESNMGNTLPHATSHFGRTSIKSACPFQ